MKSRKVGVDKKHKRNATKRKQAAKLKKSKKKKLNKRKRRTRKRTRRQRGGNADFVVVVIGTHGCYWEDEDNVNGNSKSRLLSKEIPEGMNIRKITASPIGMINNSVYDITSESSYEEMSSIIQEVFKEKNNRENGSRLDLSSIASSLAGNLKKEDKYTQNVHFLDGEMMLNSYYIRNPNELESGEQDEDGIEKDKKDLENTRKFKNKTDRRFEIEIINKDHPYFFDKILADTIGNNIVLYQPGKAPENISRRVKGSMPTRKTFYYLSNIIDYLHYSNMNNVIIVDLSCSVIGDSEDGSHNIGFSDREIRSIDRDLKYRDKVLPNPYLGEWEKKRKLSDYNPVDNDYHRALEKGMEGPKNKRILPGKYN